MASQFFNTIKYGLLTVAAFFGPKIITDSGIWVGNVEKQWDTPQSSSTESGQSRVPQKGKEKRPFREREKTEYPNESGSRNGKGTYDSIDQEERFRRPISFSNSSAGREGTERSQSDSWRTVITPIEEIFRFDYYPASMVQRWSRVDTVQSEYPLRGYRVVVLTGTKENDLSGVLTCYFNEWEMRRIDFYGKTGDFSKTLKYLTDHYGLKFRENSTPNYFIYESGPEKEGEKNQLLVSPASVFYADQKKNAFAVRIVLYRPE
ncbi:MAG: hypothetical protein Q4G69_02260 [Planctomycetia bacterium]|nr:hypothetical protein [Planctomycetia bacterium]